MKTTTFTFKTDENTIYKAVQISENSTLVQWTDGNPRFTTETVNNMKRRIERNSINILSGDEKW